jgi:outer membrane protein OmpA-like peptidoglycan-associated protein
MRSTTLFLITLAAMASPWAVNAYPDNRHSPTGGMSAGFGTSAVYDIPRFSLSPPEADASILDPLARDGKLELKLDEQEIGDSSTYFADGSFLVSRDVEPAHLALINLRWDVAPPTSSPEPGRTSEPAPSSGPPMPSQPSPLTRTFAVFFDFDSSRLDDKAVETVALATETARQGDRVIIQVIGPANAAEPVLHNLDLADRRAAAVKAELVNDGIPEGDIAVTGKALETPMILARSKAWELRNRAVIDMGT